MQKETLLQPARANIRTGLTAFGGTLLGLFTVLFAIGWVLQSLPLFGPNSRAHFRQNIDLLTPADVLAVKAAHASRTAPYQVGLFGNSRAVEVSHTDVGLPPMAFFNFAVGGTSFRQSVALLEYLSEYGIAPQVAIVSIDNHDIEFVGSIYWPPIFLLPQRLIAPIPFYGPDQNPVPYWRYVFFNFRDVFGHAREQARAYLNYIRVRQRIWFLASGIVGGSQPNIQYLTDGARPENVTVDRTTMTLDRDAISEGYARLVEIDMGRLVQVQKRGTKIVIYESPIHPRVQDEIAKGRTETVREFRQRFLEICRRNDLTCRPAPLITGPLPWSDCCHPPPALLGRFIAGLL